MSYYVPSSPRTGHRADARISKATQNSTHHARNHARAALTQAVQVCDCPDCQAHLDALSSLNDDQNTPSPTFTAHLSSDFVRSAPDNPQALLEAAAHLRRPIPRYSSQPKGTR
jgi:hypothetical protein